MINRVITVPPLTPDADHDIVFIDVNTRATVPKKKPSTKFLYDKADWDSMKVSMDNYCLPQKPVQEQWNHLENFLQNLMRKYIPSKVSRPQKHKPWITRELITDTHRRDRAFAAWKRTKSEAAHKTFTTLRSLCQNKIRKAHSDYLKNILDFDSNLDNDKKKASKRFWTYVKSKKKDSCSIPPLRSEGVLIADAVGKANILNRQYSSVFTLEDTNNIPSKGHSKAPPMQSIKITVDGVKQMLQELKPQKAPGPDKISTRVLKELAEPLSKPLAEFFQHSIDSGVVPTQWKKALVTPIFKKGDKHCPANYRPVSLTAVCSKLCEHVIAKSIMNHLEENKLLCDNQHGFRKMRSCESQLIQFVDELAKSLVGGRQVDVAVMDFSKAFDVVPHQRLLRKLEFYGIGGSSLVWIEDFLTGRTQQVVIDSEFSVVAPVTSGVPQGSVLGPILFLSFINDMPECVSSKCRLFADDSIIYREVRTDRDCTQLQDDLDSLERWEKTWGMCFNPSKCNIIHVSRKKEPILQKYHIKGTDLDEVDTATYLGIHAASDLTWHKQVNKVAAKGNRALGFTKRNIRTTSQATKELAYCTLVRPVMEYAASVWSPHLKGHKEVLEKVQRRAARYVLHEYGEGTSPTNMIHRLKWESLEQRRLKARVVMTYRIVHKLVKIPSDQFVPTASSTRGHDMRFHRIYNKTNYYKYSFFPSVIKLWNALPSSVVSASTLEDFKEKLADVHLKPP